MLRIENVAMPSEDQWKAIIRGMRNPKNSWDRSDSGLGCYTEDEGALLCKDCEDGGCVFPDYVLGPNDHKLMSDLRNAGTDHRKFMRTIVVYLDITAPLYWWKEFKTYRAGRKFVDDEPDIIDDGYLEYDIEMNSCSTMHKIHSKEFELDDFSHEHLLKAGTSMNNETVDVNGLKCSAMGILQHIICALNSFRTLYLETKDKKYWWQIIQLLPSSYNQKRTVMLNYEVLANMYKSRRNHKLDEWHTFCDWIESLPYSELITGKVKGEENG